MAAVMQWSPEPTLLCTPNTSSCTTQPTQLLGGTRCRSRLQHNIFRARFDLHLHPCNFDQIGVCWASSFILSAHRNCQSLSGLLRPAEVLVGHRW